MRTTRTWEAEVAVSRAPVHSSLGDRARHHLEKSKKRIIALLKNAGTISPGTFDVKEYEKYTGTGTALLETQKKRKAACSWRK